ncbi:hypothetical protein [Shewanella dokdonensis]|uniref:PEP-CTERM protein-sorting domain-containing protein n=1 Tax=Shewanella dokdonensis TaxID=712036 RepID=A0ABX8DEC9_9GAMM|nr:hypothetical protein [Shewanella dokdonensis]MCL1072987.1 hypothetical protein [Shewanella dokdonensis]QVK23099.1 hypothetical protein KHX94_18705 [Shewanella dokdonensis]
MFNNLPTDYSVAVKTPDPIVVKIEPSEALIAIFAGILIVAAAWVKRRN